VHIYFIILICNHIFDIMGNGRRFAQRSSPVVTMMEGAVDLADCSLAAKSLRRPRKVSDKKTDKACEQPILSTTVKSVGSSRGKIQARVSDRTEQAVVKKSTKLPNHSDSDDSTTLAVDAAKKVAKTKKNKAAVPVPTEGEVLEAVASLYDDELKPYGRILRKRLSERAIAAGVAAAGEPDLAALRAACVASSWLNVESEDGGEWSALLVSCESKFVDVYNPVDSYAEAMWAAAATYFQGLTGDEAVLPGGRYSCAQSLVERKLPFLSGQSLGRVCHIVQLSISQRKCLGYLNGGITPYLFSHSKIKDSAAAQQSSCAPSACVSGLTVATWETARTYLRVILGDAMKAGTDSVPLSNIKRIFRSQFFTELSETSLGHSKLSELLQDSKLYDICTVRLMEQGYFVVPQFSLTETTTADTTANRWSDFAYTPSLMDMTSQPFSFASAERVVFCLDEPLSLDEVSSEDSTDGVLSCPDDLLCLDEPIFSMESSPVGASQSQYFVLSPSALTKDGRVGSMVQNTFIHAAEAPVTPLLGAMKRSRSLPKNLGSERSQWEASCHALSFMPEPIADTRTGIHEGLALIVPASPVVPHSPAFPSPSLTASPQCWTPQKSMLYPPTPELGLLCGVPELQPLETTFNWSNPNNNTTGDDSYFEYRPVFCANEPLSLEMVAEVASQEILPQQALAQGGYIIHNTFIDSIRPPLTPSTASAQKRSLSLPRNMGCENKAENCGLKSRFVDAAVPSSPALTASPWTPHARKPENAPLLEMSRPVLRLSDFV